MGHRYYTDFHTSGYLSKVKNLKGKGVQLKSDQAHALEQMKRTESWKES